MIAILQASITAVLAVIVVSLLISYVQSQRKSQKAKDQLVKSYDSFETAVEQLTSAINSVDLDAIKASVSSLDTEGRPSPSQQSSHHLNPYSQGYSWMAFVGRLIRTNDRPLSARVLINPLNVDSAQIVCIHHPQIRLSATSTFRELGRISPTKEDSFRQSAILSQGILPEIFEYFDSAETPDEIYYRQYDDESTLSEYDQELYAPR